jgi:hypothetical protein
MSMMKSVPSKRIALGPMENMSWLRWSVSFDRSVIAQRAAPRL